MNKQAKEQTNKGINKRWLNTKTRKMNTRTKEQTNKGTQKQTNERMKEQTNNQTLVEHENAANNLLETTAGTQVHSAIHQNLFSFFLFSTFFLFYFLLLL
jgi:hypothetical protein